jgi:aminodeoxyfutalosine synthase
MYAGHGAAEGPRLEAAARQVHKVTDPLAADLLSVADCVSLYALPLEELRARLSSVPAAPPRVALHHFGRLEYGNVCHNRCAHCAVSRPPGDPAALMLEPAEVRRRAAALADLGVGRLQLVGGANPQRGLDYFTALVAAAREGAPEVWLVGLSAQHINDLGKLERVSARDLLAALRDAGLQQLTGDGGEIFTNRVRDTICPRKITGGRWLHIMRYAHEAGLLSSASMTFGHTETPADKAEHLALLQDLHEETGGFEAYWPEPMANGYRTHAMGQEPTVEGFLREIAVGRLMLPRLPHIRCLAVPPMRPEDLPQAAAFGADEVACVTRFAAGDVEPKVADCTAARDALEAAGVLA